MAEIEDVAIGAQAPNDIGARRCSDGVALRAGGHFAVVTDSDAGLLAPDVGPPGALGSGANDGAFFGDGLLMGGLRCLAQFTVDFVLIGMREELVEELVGAREFDNALGGQQWEKPLLPVVVSAFDFTFGLWGGSVEEFDAVEVESLAELGEGIRVVGVKEGVVVDIEGQGQAIGLKDPGKEVEVSQQSFGWIEARAGIETRGIVENVQEDLFVGAVGHPRVWSGVVLPERAVVAGLPAFDGFGRTFEASIWGQVILDGPAPDTGAVGLELEATEEFAGDGTVGTRRFGGEEFGDEGGDVRGPVWMMISAGKSGRPSVGIAMGAGAEVSGVQFVEAGT